MDLIGMASILATKERIVVSNASADNLLKDESVAERVLKELKRSSHGSGMPDVFAIMNEVGRPIVVRRTPLFHDSDEALPAGLHAYIIQDLGRFRVPNPDLLARLFHLTPAEIRVVTLFAQGDDVPTIAAALNVQVGTVRMQLKSIQSKTGARRQAELAMLLSQLASMSLPDLELSR